MIWLRMALRMETTNEQDITAVIIWTDVTAERALRERLSHSTKLAQLGEVATGVAHELNQPLAAISLSAENALDGLSDLPQPAPRVAQKLERILELVTRATRVVDHMRIFGRIGTAEPQSTRLEAIIAGAESLMRSKLRTAGVRLESENLADLPSLLVHATPIEQVLMNLIGNACDAYAELKDAVPPERLMIRIAASVAENVMRITITDWAGGIPQEVLPRIFEPFFTTKPVGSGTGLGLSISYGIVTEMGGTIEAAALDGGTVFSITLPIVLQS
jgi:C4-dicarboxylate-specific signal transduction histidine kinase